MVWSPLSRAHTLAAAFIKVHSPHSSLSFFFDQSKHCSRGTFAFPFPYPQADTKVPSETEHKHSEVAVTQGRLVWELTQGALLFQQALEEPKSKDQREFRSRNQILMVKTQMQPQSGRAHTDSGWWMDQACSPVNSNGGHSWQVEGVNFPGDPSMTVGKGSPS